MKQNNYYILGIGAILGFSVLFFCSFAPIAKHEKNKLSHLDVNHYNQKQRLQIEKNIGHTLAPVEIDWEDFSSKPAYTCIDVSNLSKKQKRKFFTISPISKEIFSRMKGKSYKKNCSVSKNSLRYVRILHKDLDGNTRIGELMVHRSIAKKVKKIFIALYEQDYPIEKMVLIDEYDADDNESMADNNSSCFNYRKVEGSNKLSKHSLGLAIDINPRYNPYIHRLHGKTVVSPSNGKEYADRSKSFPYKIDKKDLAYKLFTKAGFTWGGNWNSVKDYQHFQMD